MNSIITHQDVVSKIQSKFGNSVLEAFETYGMLTINIQKDKIYQLLEFLRDEPTLNFHFLTDLTAVHYPFRKDEELELVYHLHNMIANVRIKIKASIPSENPDIDSIVNLFPAANWQERETFDFYGINFLNHPDLRRIMNVDDMDYHPLLKQYPLEDATREDKDDAMFGR